MTPDLTRFTRFAFRSSELCTPSMQGLEASHERLRPGAVWTKGPCTVPVLPSFLNCSAQYSTVIPALRQLYISKISRSEGR